MVVAFANIFMARIENLSCHRYLSSPYFSAPSLNALSSAEASLSRRGGLEREKKKARRGRLLLFLLGYPAAVSAEEREVNAVTFPCERLEIYINID